MKLAAIDIGTNSVKLTVVRAVDGRLQSLHEETKVTRPGEGVLSTGRISKVAMKRTLRVIDRYRGTAVRLGAERVIVGATETLRRAKNSREFAEALRGLGLELTIIDRRTEAQCSFLGASAFSGVRTALIADLGGGSVEVVMGCEGRVTKYTVLPLGVVFLTERFIRNDPPTRQELESMRRYVRRSLQPLSRWTLPQSAPLIGIGGTAASLAFANSRRRTFDVEAFNGRRLTAKQISTGLNRLSKLTIRQRQRSLRIDPGRADVILAGALVLEELLRVFRRRLLIVCTYGVRHGLVLLHLQGR